MKKCTICGKELNSDRPNGKCSECLKKLKDRLRKEKTNEQ